MQPILTTPRLTLRPYELSDAERVQHLAGDERIARMTANIPHPYEDGMAEQWISQHRDWFANKTAVPYAMVLTESHELIGTISLAQISEGRGNLGYWVGVPYWGHGYCTEAAAALIDYAFSSLNLTQIYAQHLTENPASGRVMVKNGLVFVREDELNGHRVSHYELEREDWLSLAR